MAPQSRILTVVPDAVIVCFPFSLSGSLHTTSRYRLSGYSLGVMAHISSKAIAS